LRATRLSAGFSQRAFAKRLHLHQTAVSKIETGERRPGLDLAVAIEHITRQLGNPIPVTEWLRDQASEEKPS
jgi:transcriptional regulator with XRE-family HTH domain